MSRDLFEVRTGFCHEFLRLDCIRVRYPRVERASLGERPRAAATAAPAGAGGGGRRRTGQRRCDDVADEGRGDGAGRARSAAAARDGEAAATASAPEAAAGRGAHGACGSAGEEVLPHAGAEDARGHHGRERSQVRARPRPCCRVKPPRSRACVRARARGAYTPAGRGRPAPLPAASACALLPPPRGGRGRWRRRGAPASCCLVERAQGYLHDLHNRTTYSRRMDQWLFAARERAQRPPAAARRRARAAASAYCCRRSTRPSARLRAERECTLAAADGRHTGLLAAEEVRRRDMPRPASSACQDRSCPRAWPSTRSWRLTHCSWAQSPPPSRRAAGGGARGYEAEALDLPSAQAWRAPRARLPTLPRRTPRRSAPRRCRPGRCRSSARSARTAVATAVLAEGEPVRDGRASVSRLRTEVRDEEYAGARRRRLAELDGAWRRCRWRQQARAARVACRAMGEGGGRTPSGGTRCRSKTTRRGSGKVCEGVARSAPLRSGRRGGRGRHGRGRGERTTRWPCWRRGRRRVRDPRVSAS